MLARIALPLLRPVGKHTYGHGDEKRGHYAKEEAVERMNLHPWSPTPSLDETSSIMPVNVASEVVSDQWRVNIALRARDRSLLPLCLGLASARRSGLTLLIAWR